VVVEERVEEVVATKRTLKHPPVASREFLHPLEQEVKRKVPLWEDYPR